MREFILILAAPLLYIQTAVQCTDYIMASTALAKVPVTNAIKLSISFDKLCVIVSLTEAISFENINKCRIRISEQSISELTDKLQSRLSTLNIKTNDLRKYFEYETYIDLSLSVVLANTNLKIMHTLSDIASLSGAIFIPIHCRVNADIIIVTEYSNSVKYAIGYIVRQINIMSVCSEVIDECSGYTVCDKLEQPASYDDIASDAVISEINEISNSSVYHF